MFALPLARKLEISSEVTQVHLVSPHMICKVMQLPGNENSGSASSTSFAYWPQKAIDWLNDWGTTRVMRYALRQELHNLQVKVARLHE